MDDTKLTDFLNRFVGDLGATMAAGNVVVGERLGLYRALATEPMLPADLATRTGTAARYVDEWLRGQAAGGYVEYDRDTGHYSLSPEQAFALTDPDGVVFAPGAFQLALGTLRAEERITEAFRDGRRCRLARTRQRGVRRLRALLPARVQRESRRRMDPGAGRGGGEAARGSGGG
ncbi:hypothetical protein [Pseudonocardia sp. TRM90224]|uniref:hypothetical protein n=1 Tax=Pseudonocardia sp. TRM90224 TaxID=2812678 RepID=UPI001E588DF0|nr:hypothetical protein [Pseudonocardia sp. TRM90224]